MKEMNQAIYYTTAQVKDKVELSDQNVRKYVRLLEDRKYEVAKDEHNRRLFSQGDVEVLKAFIKLAKQPGYTLETAADEIIEEVPSIVTETSQNVHANVTNSDINQMLGVVMDKLEAMQQENRELKNNVHRLVEKLDEYGKYSQTLSLQYKDEDKNEEWNHSAGSGDAEVYEDVQYEETPRTDDGEKEDAGERMIYTSDIGDQEKSSASNVDMSNYDAAEDDSEREETGSAAQSNRQDEEEKGGYFSKLFSMFKK